jgi:hypothetical protein
MTACCQGYDEAPRHSLAALLSYLLHVACAGLIARGAEFGTQLRRRGEARQTSDALRWLNDRELWEIGITRPTWSMLTRQRQGFGARPREPENWR